MCRIVFLKVSSSNFNFVIPAPVLRKMIKFNTGLGEILSKVFLSNSMHTVEPLLRDTVMIMHSITLKEGEIQKRNKI